ncbi:MAG: molybdopterin molybdotransferase MoeA [Acidimicrobiales bacterium]|nr:molybdopterin molybdotransferase MoeA [Acidimicrobiales bacterium]
MVPLSEARSHVLARCAPRGPIAVPLPDALGCVLAGPVVAPEPVPPWANSAMDGYAVRAADVTEASDAAPVRLAVVDTVLAGHGADRAVGAGEAVRIMTGAPVPPGADAVVMVERTLGGPDAPVVDVLEPVVSGRNVREAGSDIAAGSTVVDAGRLLGPVHLGVLASVGVRHPVVIPRPRVGVISTGDELVDDDRPLGPGQIRESNRPMLVALGATLGVDAIDLGTVPDDAGTIERALREAASTCDAVVTTGGVSMGDVDLVRVVLDRIADMRWMQVAIRPAKPFAFGVLDGTPVFGLPGNPVSSLVSLCLLGVPGLRRLAGRADLDLTRVRATAGEALPRRRDGRTAYLRASAAWDDGRLVVRPVRGQGSHQQSAALDADALIELPDGDGARAGDQIDAILLRLPAAVGEPSVP